MADYIGLMESLVRKIGVRRISILALPENTGGGDGIVVASNPLFSTYPTDEQEN